jgi:hydrogenase/urease accessory protein HupE
VNTRFGDFYGGMLHLLLSLEHVLPLLAMGLLAGLQPPASARWVVPALPLGLLCGILPAVLTPGHPFPGWLGMLTLVIPGLLVTLAWRPGPRSLAALAWGLGLIQGYGNGLAIGDDIAPMLFGAGVLVGGFLLITLISASILAMIPRANWMDIAVRAAGSWLAALGLMVAAT